MSEPRVLTINEKAISEKKAKENVDEILLLFGFNPPLLRAEWSKKKYKFNFGTEIKELRYLDLILEARKFGVIYSVQEYIDKADNIFGGTFGISTPNHQLPLTTMFAGYTKTLQSPSRTVPIEQELANDILFYREETCIESEFYDFEMCCRNYRAYLFASISLIDAFINKHILIYNNIGLSNLDFKVLKENRNTDERIELLVKISSDESNILTLHQSNAWSDYKKLKDLRNNIVHSLEPFFGHSIPELADNLNLIRSGVGELLKIILKFQGKSSLGFVEKLRNAPEVFYNQITMRADGNHFTKKKENN